MDFVDFISIAIGAVTVCLLIALLVMMRTTYVLVRRDQARPSRDADENVTPAENQ